MGGFDLPLRIEHGLTRKSQICTDKSAVGRTVTQLGDVRKWVRCAGLQRVHQFGRVLTINSITQYLDISQSAIYWFDAVNEEWSKLESTVDLESQTVNAVTQNVGMFEVQAPLACPADSFEFDDTFYQANELDIKSDSALHVLDIPDDEDWMWFEPITDTTYSL